MKEEIQNAKWWQYGHVWLVILGPAFVVVASVATGYIALVSPDPVIDDYYRKGMEINKTLEHNTAMTPALIARNHAANGKATESVIK